MIFSRLDIGCLLIILCLIACNKPRQSGTAPESNASAVETNVSFTLMPAVETGVDFSNTIIEDTTYNFFTYEYLYNGGGVAVGDLNGDSLPDLYFTSSFRENKLYINQGNFKFTDVTALAGVGAQSGFKTGVSVGDINGDGRMDIYSCRTSKVDDGRKDDFVFINQGNKQQNGISIPYFTEQAKALGLNDNSNTNQVVMLDYDRDGDLDIFLLNHRTDFHVANQLRLQQLTENKVARILTPETVFESNRLYKNEDGHFIDVTGKSGVQSSAFGLGVIATDINQDGWIDLYVGNDYVEPDQVLINNRNGTFSDQYSTYIHHTSLNSMGTDVADINNDGLLDIMVLDMKAAEHVRYKQLMNAMQYDRYHLLKQYGYGDQTGRNVLQLNNGNNTFSEIGEYAGISATDWSWGTLLADFDNDGWKDSYIANGFVRDVTDFDYINFTRDSLQKTKDFNDGQIKNFEQYLKHIPQVRLSNYLFINNHHLKFVDMTAKAGLERTSLSNGSAYADLDMDGDLDIIVNNIDEPAFLYRNDTKGQHWVQVDLTGKAGNPDGLGATVNLYAGGVHQVQVLSTTKSFLSCSEPLFHFGLGSASTVDSIILTWPGGEKEIMRSIPADQRIYWKPGSGSSDVSTKSDAPAFLFTSLGFLPGWVHAENDFVDFKREKLMPYMLSHEGPCMSLGDLNGDKLEDIYLGSGNGHAGIIFFQNANESFTPTTPPSLTNDAGYEDCGSVITDFDGDGDADLVVISGGNAYDLNDPLYMTRLYVNDGKGGLTRALDFPDIRTNAGAILPFDYDGDQDKDLLIGGRSIPGAFPQAPKSYLLKNTNGKFQDVTTEVFPDFEEIGMVTDIQSADLNGDGIHEIVIAGEWMPIRIFSFDGKKIIDKSDLFGLAALRGLWKCIRIDDVDNDGDQDIIAGNIGLNHRMVTSDLYPITLVSNDFDGNGSQDPVLCYYVDGHLFPYAGKDALISQIPMLKKKFIRYSTYATATLDDIFEKSKLDASLKLTANTFSTLLLINHQNKFSPKELPYEIQLSPVMDIMMQDFNNDGLKDILMAGNFKYSETETGVMDAGNGCVLLQQPDGTFKYVNNRDHGFWAQGEVRELELLHMAKGQEVILTGNNMGPIEVHLIKNSEKQVQ